ncbi:unnamed protein product [Soboliphyme baturini]|uniref:GOLGA2L5 domain-containing protein n=1 Tax=Soboliphyme baturini TaxID=241478 RepID=A0A183IGI7_9BILA|nr:unnamed protein product [Soboliphyme baturini]
MSLRRYQQQQSSVAECVHNCRIPEKAHRQCRKSCSVSPDSSSSSTFRHSRHRTSSLCSFPATTGFRHDELRSPFTYVRSRSQHGPGPPPAAAAPVAASVIEMAMEETVMTNGQAFVASNVSAEHCALAGADSNLPVSAKHSRSECSTCDILRNENARLNSALGEQNALSQQVIGQYNKLQEQYSKLYEAYNTINDRVPTNVSHTTLNQMDQAGEIQNHVKVINVLVDEKSELQSQLRQTMEIANAHYAEKKSLEQMLKVEQDRTLALESELQQLKCKDTNLESTLQKQLIELNNCCTELAQNRKRTSELQQERSELSAKLKMRTREVKDLNQKLKDLEGSYQASQIYVQQMKGLTLATDKEEEKYLTELKEKNTEIENLKNAVAYLKRELASSQTLHTSFTREWNDKILKLNDKIQQLNAEKVAQAMSISQLTANLETALSDVSRLKQEQQTMPAVEQKPNSQLERLNEKLREVEAQLIESKDMRDSMEKEMDALKSEVRTKTDRLNAISQELSEHNLIKNNTRELLEQLRNEKATSSRAVAQNMELKQQLLELQTKLVQTALINRLQSSSREGKNKNCEETLEDEDNEHKAVSHDVFVLEHELSECKDRIQQLSTENSELHCIMEHNAEDENQNTIYVELQHALHRITTLSQENESLKNQLKSQSDKRQRRDSKNEDDGRENGDAVASNMSNNSSEANEDKEEMLVTLKHSMEQLQQRFVRAMSENANLSEQNQQLEHLIVQLQSETDTIGEYVTLYRYQRKVVKERLRDHEDYIARLAREKEIMQPYTKTPATYNKPKPLPPSKPPQSVNALVETLIDETVQNVENGDQPDSRKRSFSANASSQLKNEARIEKADLLLNGRMSVNRSSNQLDDENSPTSTVCRILRLLDEIQNPSPSNEFHVSDIHLHCKHCKGTLVTL